MFEPPPALWTIVLNWKRPDITSKCVRSLLASTYTNHTIAIVDNGSNDGSAELLRREFPCIDLIESSENLGFSRGCNLGIRHAFACGAQYVALVNNDLTLEADGYVNAMDAFAGAPRVGAVTGKIFTDEPNLLWQAGGRISHLRVAGLPRGHFEVDHGQYDAPGMTGWASGAMSVFSSMALERVGLLPEEYFFGQEEWDVSTNLINSGFDIAYIPTFVGHHGYGGSYKRHPALNSYGGTRNRLMYADKYLPAGRRKIWKAIFWCHIRVVMPTKLRRTAHDLPDISKHLRAMQLGFARHKRNAPVTLEEIEGVSRELDVSDTWTRD